jgi:hypothetical protein
MVGAALSKMNDKSRYDGLHDRFSTVLSSKAGTRYERLAAFAFKSLGVEHAVIHDLRLVGSSEVKHQIDVTVERDGGLRRVLIECKDFDLSGRRVGLGVIRDFFGAVEDVKPNEAIVLTCTGFTQPAEKYAKAKGIKLAVMRAFEEADWEGRIRTVIVNLIVEGQPRIEKGDIDMDDANKAQFAADAGTVGSSFRIDGGSMVFLNGLDEEPFADVLLRLAGESRRATGLRTVEVEFPADTLRLSVCGGLPISFRKFVAVVTFPPPLTTQVTINNDRIAELILQGLGEHDSIVFADQLAGLKIGESGEVEN